MRKNMSKSDVAVLIHIPRSLYEEYEKIVRQNGRKIQQYSASLFTRAITCEIYKNKKEGGAH